MNWKVVPISLALATGSGCLRAQAQKSQPIPACVSKQDVLSQVTGLVTDVSGAAVAGAQVTVQCGERRRTVSTDAAGHYNLRVSLGEYVLVVSATGFARIGKPISVSSSPTTADLILRVANASENVTVTANDYVALTSATGTKTETPLIETPEAISVVTSQELRDRDTQTVDDALRYTAGVDAEPYGIDTRLDWFYIRGFFSTFDSLFLDGLALPKITGADAAWTANPFSLESVTIIKGPASVLYGQAEPGGLVDLESKRPPTSSLHELRFEGGTFNRFQGFADMGGPLGKSHHWFYRVNGLARDSGTQANYVPDNLDYIAPALTWTPGEGTSLTLLGNYLDFRTGSAASGTPAQGMMLSGGKVPINLNGNIPTSYFGSEPGRDAFHKVEYFTSTAFQHRFSDKLVFRQNFRWLHLGLPEYIGLYGNGFAVPAGAEATCAADPNAAICTRYSALSAINANQNNTQYTLDNQFQYSIHSGAWSHALLAGYNYQHQGAGSRAGYGPSVLSSPNDPTAGPILNIFAPVYGAAYTLPAFNYMNTTGTLAQHGVYLQDQMSYRHLTLMLSGREDWAVEHEHDLNVSPQPLSCPNAGSAACIDQNASKFTGRAGVLYHTASGVAPYFSYSTSFNPILGVNTTYDASGNALVTKPYLPDTGQQYEIGAKYQPRSLNALFTAALFQVTENNLQTSDPTNPINTVQSAQQRSRGIELEGQASLSHNLNVKGSFTHEQVLYTKPFYGVVNVKPDTVPANLASLWLDYTPRTRFGVGAGVRFKGLSPGALDNSLFVDSHTLFDAEAHYTLNEQVRLGFNAQNLLDKVYVAYCYGLSDCNYGLRRTMNGNITYRFNSLLEPWKTERRGN